MQVWQPANPFEQRLLDAFSADDMVTCLALLRGSEFALPITAAAAAGDEPAVWMTMESGGVTWLLAYTSIEGMEAATGGQFRHCRVSTLVDLAAGWPDQRWGLAINAGLPAHFALESGTVARLAVPGLAEDKMAYPEAPPPLMQKLLTPQDIANYIGERQLRVSGYVHQLVDVEHIATPSVLVDALGENDRRSELITEDGSLNMLRWSALGMQLYRTPYGGIDEERMAAVAGWVIEEPPFVGLGLGRNVDQVIREYKVDGVGLPHGAEIWELAADGREHRRAILDADRGVWMLVVKAPPDDVTPEDGAAKLEEWVTGLDGRLRHLETVLPDEFPFDFSVASLDQLEMLVVQGFGDAQGTAAEEDDMFLEGVVAYLGEALLRVGGGRWAWEAVEEQSSGQPVVLPDERLGTPAVSPIFLLMDAVGGDGGAFARAAAALHARVDAVRAEDATWMPVQRPPETLP